MAKTTSFRNILGKFELDDNLKLKSKEPQTSNGPEEDIKLSDAERIDILSNFKDRSFFKAFRDKNLRLTKDKIKGSFTDDILVIQASKSIEEIDRTINSHAKRLREWFSYAVPELSELTPSHEEYINKVIELKDIPEEFDMSVDILPEHMDRIKRFAETINVLYEERKSQEEYLKKMVGRIAPNLTALAGSNVASKLVSLAGSLEKLSKFPAPKIQLMGAEVALFRHLQTGSKPPKHGVILEHPLIAQSKRQYKGKIARKLADKISIAAKVDFFKGEFIGMHLLQTLQKDVDRINSR